VAKTITAASTASSCVAAAPGVTVATETQSSRTFFSQIFITTGKYSNVEVVHLYAVSNFTQKLKLQNFMD
jgi:hypothetical protein